MLERTWLRKVSVVVFLLALVILLAFSVKSEEIISDSITSVSEIPSEEIVQTVDNSQIIVQDLETVVEGENSEVVYVSLDETEQNLDSGIESVESEATFSESENEICSDKNVCVPLDDLLNDSAINSEEKTSDSVLLNLEDVSSFTDEGASESATNELILKENKETPVILFDEGKKVMETVADSAEEERVFKRTVSEENVAEISNDQLVKEVIVSNEEHYGNEIVYYTDLLEEAREDRIKVNWKNEGKEVSFKTYDFNGNGLVDRISFEVPHLSTQIFEVIIDLGMNEDQNLTEIILTNSYSPTLNVNITQVSFGFNISYYNLSLVSCSFDLSNLSGNIWANNFSAQSRITQNFSLSNGVYNWNMNCVDLINSSISKALNGTFSINYNYNLFAKLNASPTAIVRGNSVSFVINASAPVEGNLYYILKYGDGTNYSGSLIGKNLFQTLSHTYNSSGSFSVNLTVNADYGGFTRSANDYASISVSEPVPQGDTEGPKINLIQPSADESFDFNDTSEEIVFVYNVTDNVRISNCSFEIYYYNDSSFGERVLSELKSDISNGSNVTYRYHDFDEGDYSWDVECYDNSSNRGIVSDRDFSVNYPNSDTSEDSSSRKRTTASTSTSNSDEIAKVDELINSINDFIVAEEKFSPEEREAITDLGLDENLKFYKKKLLQMKLDLDHNLDYVQGDDKKIARRQEILEEIENMTKAIPASFSVSGSQEFFKNSLEMDMNEVVSAYVQAKGIVLDSRGVKDMAKQNLLLQNQLTVSARVKKVSLEYLDGTRENFVLVAKDLSLKSRDFDSIIEVLPKELVDNSDYVEFLVENSILKKDTIIEISLEKLTGDKLVYKILKDVNLKNVELTSTLAFKEDIPQSTLGGVTGFVSLVGNINMGFGFYLSWILAFMFVVFLGIFSYRGIRMNKLKKHKDVRTLMALSAEIQKLVEAKEIGKAREKYHHAQSIYPSLPEEGKKFAYEKLRKLNLEIDKKDISLLVREFMTASKEGRKNDALMLYSNIQKLYPKMPEKYKDKVFEKIDPYLKGLK